MQGPNPRSFALANDIDFPRDTRISPGDDIERKQHENRRSSHQELINNDI